MNLSRKIKVLIVDDSSVFRTLLSRILSSDKNIEVVGVAPDAYVAREKILSLNPDVMTLDVEMPKMDGVTFLEKVMTHKPLPTIVLSSLTQEGSINAMKAYEAGAVEVLPKPTINDETTFNQASVELINAVKVAAQSRINKVNTNFKKNHKSNLTKSKSDVIKGSDKILVIGSSTGGTTALRIILSSLPENIPPILIVQHMPPVFTKTFSEHLNEICPFTVKEAEDGDRVEAGTCYIAPGNFHMEVVNRGMNMFLTLNQNPPKHGVRPSVDILMHSVAKIIGKNATGVILTGMGVDGAEGLLEMKNAGSYTIAQDEASSVVFGMPKQAIECGSVLEIVSLDKMSNELIKHF